MSTTGAKGAAERSGLGERLRDARVQRGLSLQELAELTKIPSSNLDAIENGQIRRLPGGIFARSFVRAYAREVGLDPEAAVRDFVREHPEHAPPDAQDTEGEEAAESREAGNAGRVVAAIAALALVGGAGFVGYRWWQGGGISLPFGSQRSVATESRPSMPPVAAQPSPGTESAPSAGSEAGGPANRVVEVPPPQATVTSPGPAAPEPAAAAAPLVAPAPASPVETSLPPPAGGGIRLEIHPTAPCWVRVSADGRVRLERLVQPGERPVVVAGEGIQLQVGDAGAFDYTINGQRGRPLGAAGRVVRVEIARDTVADFVVR